jgi:hypothetical protein
MYLFCNSRILVITLYSGHVCLYYASMLRCWHLIWILVRTDHPCLGVGRHTGRGGCSGSEARLRVTVRGVVTTTLMGTRVANPMPSVPLGHMRVSLWCSHGLLCCLHTSLPKSARWSYEAVACLSHPIKLQCKTFTRVQSKARAR